MDINSVRINLSNIKPVMRKLSNGEALTDEERSAIVAVYLELVKQLF